jgi:hypothetical protein
MSRALPHKDNIEAHLRSGRGIFERNPECNLIPNPVGTRITNLARTSCTISL